MHLKKVDKKKKTTFLPADAPDLGNQNAGDE